MAGEASDVDQVVAGGWEGFGVGEVVEVVEGGGGLLVRWWVGEDDLGLGV